MITLLSLGILLFDVMGMLRPFFCMDSMMWFSLVDLVDGVISTLVIQW